MGSHFQLDLGAGNWSDAGHIHHNRRGKKVFQRKGHGKSHHFETKGNRCGRRECIHALIAHSVSRSREKKDILVTENRRETLTRS